MCLYVFLYAVLFVFSYFKVVFSICVLFFVFSVLLIAFFFIIFVFVNCLFCCDYYY